MKWIATGPERFHNFMDFVKIKNTVVFQIIFGRLIQKHSLKGALLSRCSEVFGQNL